jgi:hypothetical protein
MRDWYVVRWNCSKTWEKVLKEKAIITRITILIRVTF